MTRNDSYPIPATPKRLSREQITQQGSYVLVPNEVVSFDPEYADPARQTTPHPYTFHDGSSMRFVPHARILAGPKRVAEVGQFKLFDQAGYEITSPDQEGKFALVIDSLTNHLAQGHFKVLSPGQPESVGRSFPGQDDLHGYTDEHQFDISVDDQGSIIIANQQPIHSTGIQSCDIY